MRTLLPTLTITFSVLSGVAIAATGDAPKGYGDKKWGATSTAGLKKFMGPTADGTSLFANTKPPKALHGIAIREESYSYTHGKLFNGTAYLVNRADLLRMKDALTKLHGSPDFANDGRQIWKWKWPAASVEISLYGGTVSFTNNGI
jgi:hypothetical protein